VLNRGREGEREDARCKSMHQRQPMDWTGPGEKTCTFDPPCSSVDYPPSKTCRAACSHHRHHHHLAARLRHPCRARTCPAKKEGRRECKDQDQGGPENDTMAVHQSLASHRGSKWPHPHLHFAPYWQDPCVPFQFLQGCPPPFPLPHMANSLPPRQVSCWADPPLAVPPSLCPSTQGWTSPSPPPNDPQVLLTSRTGQMVHTYWSNGPVDRGGRKAGAGGAVETSEEEKKQPRIPKKNHEGEE
jgi:hypothetical protein